MNFSIAIVLLLAVCSIQGKSIGKENDDVLNEMEVSSEKDVLDKMHFLLWNRANPTNYVELKTGNAAILQQIRYDITIPTIIFAHGFTMNGRNEKVLKMRDEYLKFQDCNFISVDWEKLANAPNYHRAVNDVKLVGEATGDLITFLNKFGTAQEKFHLVGFSLGSHVVGKAASSVAFDITRVTGLEPAHPEFSLKDTNKRLDKSDALFVDVVHTNSASLSFPDAIGHVDFYVNGGMSQPGCGLISGDPIDLLHGCSHGRAVDYFTESINGQVEFTGTLCDSWKHYTSNQCKGNTNKLGEHIDTSNLGIFYLATNSKSPFAKK